MSKLTPTNAADVTPPPPWQREEFHYSEVPAVVKHFWNFTISKKTAYRWLKKGRTLSADKAQTGFLASHTVAGRVYVTLADLKAFLRAT